jgi:hypothetical protein
MRDVFHPRDVEWLTDRFRLAAKGRWQRLSMLCDEGNQQVGTADLLHLWVNWRAHFMRHHTAILGTQGYLCALEGM